MDALEAVEKEIEKVCTKFQNVQGHFDSTLDNLITFVTNLKKEYDEAGKSGNLALKLFGLISASNKP